MNAREIVDVAIVGSGCISRFFFFYPLSLDMFGGLLWWIVRLAFCFLFTFTSLLESCNVKSAGFFPHSFSFVPVDVPPEYAVTTTTTTTALVSFC